MVRSRPLTLAIVLSCLCTSVTAGQGVPRGTKAGGELPAAGPTGVSAEATPDGVKVQWGAVAKATQYVIVRAPAAGTTGTPIGRVAAGTLIFVDRGAQAAAAYRVIAVLPNGAQAASAIVAFSPAPSRPVAVADPRTRPTFTGTMPPKVPAGLSVFAITGSSLNVVTAVRIGGVAHTFGPVACVKAGTMLLINSQGVMANGANTVELVSPIGTTTGTITGVRAVITSVYPEAAKPGETVKILGEHLAELLSFNAVTPCNPVASGAVTQPTVTFNGFAGTNVQTDGQQVVAQVPTHASGILRVSSPWHGTALWSRPFVESPAPSNVQQGSVQPGGSSSVSGTGMDAVDSVAVGSSVVRVNSKTYDRVTFTVPATLTGPADLPVTLYAKVPGFVVGFGAVNNVIHLLPIVKLTSVTPEAGAPGDNITLVGPSIGSPIAGAPLWKPSVTFNGVTSPSVIVNSPNQLTAVVPNDASTGPLVVTASGGPLPGPSIRIDRTPRLESMYPLSGQKVGQPIQIMVRTGSPPTSISFGGFAVTSGWTVNQSYGRADIRMNLPAGALSGPVIVTTRDGRTSWTAAPWTIFP